MFQHSAGHRNDRWQRRERRLRRELFLVTTAAVTLLFLIAGSYPGPPPETTAVLRWQADPQVAEQLGLAASPDQVVAEIRAAAADKPRSSPSSPNEATGADLSDAVLEATSLEVAKGAAGGELQLIYRGHVRNAAQTLQVLAERFVAKKQQQLDSLLDESRQRVARRRAERQSAQASLSRLRTELRDAEQARDKLQAGVAARSPKQSNSDSSARAPGDRTSASSNPADRSRRTNPEWAELTQKLASLENHRSQLLIDLTPLHPAIQAIDARIDAMEQRIALLPRYLNEPDNGEAMADRRPESKKLGEQPLVVKKNLDDELREAETGVAALQAEIRLAKNRLDRLAGQESAALAVPKRLEEASIGISRKAVTVEAGGLGLPWIALLSLVAGLVCGGVAAHRAVPLPDVFRSREQFEEHLAIPVLTELEPAADSPAARPIRLSPAMNMVRHGGEIVLITAALALFVMACVDSQFAAQLVSHPLRALSGASRDGFLYLQQARTSVGL